MQRKIKEPVKETWVTTPIDLDKDDKALEWSITVKYVDKERERTDTNIEIVAISGEDSETEWEAEKTKQTKNKQMCKKK